MSGIKGRCPIWGTECEDFTKPGWDGRDVRSPRAGGDYMITGNACTRVGNLGDLEKAKLSRWIYEQNQWRDTPPTIDSEIVRGIPLRRTPTVMERIDCLLQFVELETKGAIGMPVPHSNKMCAATVVSNSREMDYLIRQAEDMGLVTTGGAVSAIERRAYAGITEIKVKGYQRLEDLKGGQVDSDQAFVAMWFDVSMEDVWENGFQPAIADTGYHPMRIDKKEYIDKIDDEIIAEICRSRFVVADFTSKSKEPRGGVYYEAGFARGMSIPVIFTCYRGMVDELHLDTRQYNHILWDDPGELRGQLRRRILKVFGQGRRQRGNRG